MGHHMAELAHPKGVSSRLTESAIFGVFLAYMLDDGRRGWNETQ